MSILETKKLTKRFDGVVAINGLSIGIEAETITGIVGPNGSGKTTLINVLSGMLPFENGSVRVNNAENLRVIRPRNIPLYGITRTFQNIRLFEQMTVLDNIMVVLTKRNVFSALFERHTAYRLKQAEDVLRAVNLWEKRNDLAINLSYGQRKLLEIARALAMQSDIFLLDEPFAGLFPEMVKTVSGIIKDLKDHRKTVVLIEHNMNLIRELCDHVIVMDGGVLLSQGVPERVLAEKKVIEAYLGK